MASTMRRMRTALWHLRHGGVAQARTHLRRQRRSRHLPGDGELLDAGGHLMFEPWSVLDRAPRRPGLRVAVILDDFSLSAFSHEWDQVEVTPSTWRSQLEAQPVDLLFVESAWHGNHDAWQFHLTGPSAPTAAVVGLVNWCRAHGIPTVFWNKEDPAHYDDFLAAARLFDHVYTTDSTCIERYEMDLGHERVDVLPFAAQQSIHNPVRPATGRFPQVARVRIGFRSGRWESARCCRSARPIPPRVRWRRPARPRALRWASRARRRRAPR